MPLQFGIDVLLQSTPNWKTKSIAFLTNDAATTSLGEKSRKALIDQGFNIVKLFSPEHGIYTKGEDGAKMNNEIDVITGLPVISLYGEKFTPTERELEEIDLLLFDIPDVGVRFYTYLWSMTYWLEAAAKYNKQIIILDRPNPLGGYLKMTEGPMMNNHLTSFIGRYSIPLKHQCTLGELALYFNVKENIQANLEVVTCKNWHRAQLFYDWNKPWVPTSPALQHIEACILYPGLCLFEATNVSVGRGSKLSFEWIGANWFNLPAITMIWQNILSEDIKIEPLNLSIPMDAISCAIQGIRIKVIDPYHFNAVLNGLLLLKIIKDIHPKDFEWRPYPTNANPTGKNHLSLLLGIENAESLFDLPLKDWLTHMVQSLKVTHWENEMMPYLLYE
jgi:uncharacterized protein YbbC (DUF1343 family)